MNRLGVVALLMFVGCEQIESSGDIFAPRAPSASSETATEPVGPQGGFDFDADAREVPDVDADSDPEVDIEATYAALGIDPSPASAPDREPAPVTAVAAADLPVVVPAAPVQQPWQPGVAIPGSWGVRLVSTVVDAHPPRAILGMPDGSETVVQPGTLLPSVGVVVLAIGRNAVQIAEIVPEGDRARVKSQVITALYPNGAPE